MDFPVATRIPSCEKSFWIYLPDSIMTVDVKHRQPTQAIFIHYNPEKIQMQIITQASGEKC